MELAEIARIVKGKAYGKNLEIKKILPPEEATKGCLTFLFNPKTQTLSDAVIAERRIPAKSGIIVPDCKKAMLLLLKRISQRRIKPKIAETVIIEDETEIPDHCNIEHHTIIKNGAKIGKGCYIGANVYVDNGVRIGDYCTIEHNVVLYRNTIIGNYVTIGANSVIGKEGFGYVKFSKKYRRIPHIGDVIIKDYVEIGASVCIDRATIGNTTIGEGTKIDNLVHIAHNVHIGKDCLIMGQCGIAGSSVIGDNVILCGQSGVSDHLKIGDNVVVFAKSGVFSNLVSKKKYSGIPAREHYMVLRALARLYKDL